MRRTRVPVLALVGWTVFVWLSRVRNVLADEDLSTVGVIARIGVVVVFLTLAGAVGLGLWGGPPPLGPAVRVLAGWTIVFWSVRGTAIAVDDHDASFIVVHVVLMVVSIGLAVWGLASVRTSDEVDRPAVRPG